MFPIRLRWRLRPRATGTFRQSAICNLQSAIPRSTFGLGICPGWPWCSNPAASHARLYCQARGRPRPVPSSAVGRVSSFCQGVWASRKLFTGRGEPRENLPPPWISRGNGTEKQIANDFIKMAEIMLFIVSWIPFLNLSAACSPRSSSVGESRSSSPPFCHSWCAMPKPGRRACCARSLPSLRNPPRPSVNRCCFLSISAPIARIASGQCLSGAPAASEAAALCFGAAPRFPVAAARGSRCEDGLFIDRLSGEQFHDRLPEAILGDVKRPLFDVVR